MATNGWDGPPGRGNTPLERLRRARHRRDIERMEHTQELPVQGYREDVLYTPTRHRAARRRLLMPVLLVLAAIVVVGLALPVVHTWQQRLSASQSDQGTGSTGNGATSNGNGNGNGNGSGGGGNDSASPAPSSLPSTESDSGRAAGPGGAAGRGHGGPGVGGPGGTASGGGRGSAPAPPAGGPGSSRPGTVRERAPDQVPAGDLEPAVRSGSNSPARRTSRWVCALCRTERCAGSVCGPDRRTAVLRALC